MAAQMYTKIWVWIIQKAILAQNNRIFSNTLYYRPCPKKRNDTVLDLDPTWCDLIASCHIIYLLNINGVNLNLSSCLQISQLAMIRSKGLELFMTKKVVSAKEVRAI